MSRRPDTDAIIPFRLRVGVTGPWLLQNAAASQEPVAHALGRVMALVPTSAVTPVHLTVISTLADGVERLVTYAALEYEGTVVEAILPLQPEDYKRSFTTATSQRAFDDLLARAVDVAIVEPAATLAEAFVHASRAVAERCDVLLAFGDEQSAAGGEESAEIVAFARDQHVPLLWIVTTAPYRVHEEHLGSGLALAFTHLDAFNRERARHGDLAAVAAEQAQVLLRAADSVGVAAETLQPLCDWILPHYARADALARHYQRRFFTFGATIFLLAAAATITVSVQAQFLKDEPLIALVEIAFIVLNWLIVFAARDKGRVQERWTTYRALSERLRTGLFLSLLDDATAEHTRVTLPPAHHAVEPWVDRAFAELWLTRPPAPALPVAQLRQVLAHAWLRPQLQFLRARHVMHAGRNRRLRGIINLGWAVAIVVVLLHALGAETAMPRLASLLIVLAIALPAVVAALQAIGEQRDYERNALRYEQLEPALTALARRMERVSTLAELSRVARQIEAVLLAENRDWLFSVRFRDLTISKT